MLLLRTTLLRASSALLAAVTVLSADVLASTGGHHSWWWNWCGTGDEQNVAETPEINPALAGGAITLLLGGALILTDVLRKRNAVNATN